MRPYISDKPLRRLSLPDFSGGVNYRDGMSEVLDNQLTDCKNVWYKDQTIQTRPGIKTLYEYFLGDAYGEHINAIANKNLRVFFDSNSLRVIDGENYFLTAVKNTSGISVFYCPQDKSLPKKRLVNISASDLPRDLKLDYNCLFFHHNNDIYLFVSGYYPTETTPYYIFKIYQDGSSYEYVRVTQDLPEDQGGIYIPTIMQNCQGRSEMTIYDVDGIPSVVGSNFEGYNLLGNKYKMLYTTVNTELFEGDSAIDAQAACYELIHPVVTGSKIVVNVTSFHGEGPTSTLSTVKHEVKISPDSTGWSTEVYSQSNPPKDGMFLKVSGRTLCFYDCKNPDSFKFFHKGDFVDYNNMEIIATCPNSKENYEKILNMTQAVWYGGGSEGIYGGIHLFMCGNTKEKEKSLVCWSDFNKPLYFSENCYAYVGDKAQKATTFGKQGENLIIFKEREIYATEYSAISEPIKATSIMGQSIIDVVAYEAVFPMIQVHGYIGCDCPDSVQLCRNKLVWAHSDGKVYTLSNLSQWSERSVFEVSDMIEPKLRTLSQMQLEKSHSADWEGHYILSVGDVFLLMDYNSYGFANVASFAKSDDAQKHIPWWVWEKPKHRSSRYGERPIDDVKLISIGGQLNVLAENLFENDGTWDYRNPEILVFEGKDDVTNSYDAILNPGGEQVVYISDYSSKIESVLQTKFFDFGSPTIRKQISKMDVSLGSNDAVSIIITTITDRGESNEDIILDFDEANKHNPQFFKNIAVRNAEKINNRIGYKFESKGNIFIDSMAVYFKLLGGSK